MRITPEKIRTIRMEIEQALLHYSDYKAGKSVHWKSLPYLQILDEQDIIGGYLIGSTVDRKKYGVLKLFTSGMSVEALIVRNGVSPAKITEWVNSLIDFTLEEFLRLNSYDSCPFCNARQVKRGAPSAGSYPLSGHYCMHREIRLWEEEQEYNDN